MSQDAVLNKYNEGEAKFEEDVSKYLEMNWREITCQRTVGDREGALNDSNFSNGICDYLFSVSGSTNAWIPALSYFCIDVELQAVVGGVPRPPILSDNITLSNNVGDALWNNNFFKMGGQDISTAQSFVPQQGALKKRIDQSGSWLYNIGRNASWIDPDFTRRLNVISKDGVFHQDGLVDVDGNYSIEVLAATGLPATPTTATFAPLTTNLGYTSTGSITLGGGDGVFKFGLANGSDVRLGDYITVSTTSYVLKVVEIVSPTLAIVETPPGVIYAGIGPLSCGFYRKADTQSGRYKQKVIWQPGLGIMNSYQALNCAEFKFSLNPNPNYKRSAVQSTVDSKIPGVDYILNVLNVRLYVCQVKLAMPMSTIVDLPLNEIQVQNKNLTSVSPGASNSIDFIVPPSTYGIAIFFQSNAAGNNTLLPPTTFSTAPSYGDYNLADIQSIQVTYGGVNKTSTLYTSSYNDNVNFLTQRWLQSIQYASNYNNPGGAENFNDFVRSGYYYFDFSRDRTDSSSYVNVQVTFNSQQEANTNMFIGSFYTRLVRAEYANGQLLQVTAVNA